jgi:cytochrome b pre-mRNA-processing protein 3
MRLQRAALSDERSGIVILLASQAPAGVPEGQRNCNDRPQTAAAPPANPMISLPFRRSPRSHTIDALYGTIVAQARTPSFYRGYGVPDTVAGRLDMIILHLLLVLRRLAAAPGDARLVGQEVFDRFCQDVDNNLREMGVGDLAVPKQMRRFAGAFYGRAKAYESALAQEDLDALAAALARNVFAAAEPPLGARRLAAYMRQAACRLAEQETAALVRATLDFPDPETVQPQSLQRMPNP